MWLSKILTFWLRAWFFLHVICGNFIFATVEPPTPDFSCGAELPWRTDNNRFYGTLTQTEFESIVAHRGLDKYIDLLQPPLKELLGVDSPICPESVLVIGGGFGRDTLFLRKHTNIKKIMVVEVSLAQAHFLEHELGSKSRVQAWRDSHGMPPQEIIILHENITDPRFMRMKFDVGLWLFGGVLELSPAEKRQAVSNLYNIVNTLVIEFPLGSVTTSLHATFTRSRLDLRKSADPNAPTVHLYPIDPSTREVEEPTLLQYFLSPLRISDRPRFEVIRRHDYLSESEPPNNRRREVFLRSTRPPSRLNP